MPHTHITHNHDNNNNNVCHLMNLCVFRLWFMWFRWLPWHSPGQVEWLIVLQNRYAITYWTFRQYRTITIVIEVVQIGLTSAYISVGVLRLSWKIECSKHKWISMQHLWLCVGCRNYGTYRIGIVILENCKARWYNAHMHIGLFRRS